MELYQLKTFATVADTGNLSRAAVLLNTSQPAISAQIKALEITLGTDLFTRTGKGMELTEKGAQVRILAEKVLGAAKELEDFSKNSRMNPSYVFHIAISSEPDIFRIDELANFVMSRHPGTSIEFIQNSTTDIIKKIEESKIDGGFVFGQPDRKNIGLKVLSSIDLVIVCPLSWKPKVNKAKIHEILVMPWILPVNECAFSGKVLTIFEKNNVTPKNGVSSDHETMTRHLIQSGMGISLLPESMCSGKHSEGLYIIKKEKVSIELSYAYPEKDKNTNAVQIILESLENVWKKK